ALMLDLERLRHAQHAGRHLALRDWIMQGIREHGGERGSAATRIPLLDDDAILTNFLKRVDRAPYGEARSDKHKEWEKANDRTRTAPLRLPRSPLTLVR